MKFGYDSLVHLLAGPDLDADGTSDLVVVSRLMNRHSSSTPGGQAARQTLAYVDAVSGKNGRRLWHWRTEINSWDTTPSGPVFWWGRGSDGWPMLAVPIGGDLAPGVAAASVLPVFLSRPAGRSFAGGRDWQGRAYDRRAVLAEDRRFGRRRHDRPLGLG